MRSSPSYYYSRGSRVVTSAANADWILTMVRMLKLAQARWSVLVQNRGWGLQILGPALSVVLAQMSGNFDLVDGGLSA